MSRFIAEPSFEHGAERRTGILLINLGTPDEPSPKAVRRYLREFLSDARVVEIPRILWWPILHGVILNTRPAKTARKYQSIWLKEGSPLKVYTERQTQMLRGFLGERIRSPLVVRHAMRYGNPSIASVMAEMKALHCDRILVLPLYPQYASSTTGAAMDVLGTLLKQQRNVPGIRFVRSFHDHPAYIDAIVKNVLAWWMKSGRPDFSRDRLLMSFHGLPRFHLDKGDPYHCECQKTARLIAEQLGLEKGQYLVTFQSRFGRTEWLKPYTADTLAALGKSGVRRVDAICPGFAADCLETLEEIAQEAKAHFQQAGGKEFNYIPTANDTEPWIKALTQIALDNLQGWVSESQDKAAVEAELKASAQRAREIGAKR
jgi:ferrochelatase